MLWRLCLVCLCLLDWHLGTIVFLAEIMESIARGAAALRNDAF